MKKLVSQWFFLMGLGPVILTVVCIWQATRTQSNLSPILFVILACVFGALGATIMVCGMLVRWSDRLSHGRGRDPR